MSRVIIYAKHFTTKRSCASPEKDLVNESLFIFFLDANLYYKGLRRITISNSIRQDAVEEHHSLELQSKNHRRICKLANQTYTRKLNEWVKFYSCHSRNWGKKQIKVKCFLH